MVSTTSPAVPVPRRSGARSFLPALLLDGAAEDGTRRPPERTARDWFVDVVAFLLAAAFGLGSFFTTFPDGLGGGTLAYVDLVAGALFCVALWWRRRWPVALAFATVPFGAFASSTGGASIVLLFSLAVHRPFRFVAVATVLQIVALLPYFRIHPDPEMTYWTAIVVVSALIGAVMAWGVVVRSRRQLLASLRERAERAEREQSLLVDQARQAERARIAREMHDALAHRISLLSMHAGALEFRPDAAPADVARAAGVIRASAHGALEDLREVIGVLRHTDDGDASPAPERPQPTLCDVPALLDESRAAGMRVDGDVAVADPDGVPRSLGRNAYRVVQEGLTNVRKHAAGTRAHVAVTGTPEEGLTVEVRNAAPVGGAARGPALPGAGTGIVGLAERTTLAGGRLEHGHTADGGFVLRAWMPWGSAA